MDWFLYDRDLRHERVTAAYIIQWERQELFTCFAKAFHEKINNQLKLIKTFTDYLENFEKDQ